MTMETTDAKSGTQGILLEGDLTLGNARAILERLKTGLANETTGTITIGEVESIDMSCLQLICSFHRTVLAAGGTLALQDGGSPEFQAMRRDAGFERHQGCKWNPNETCLWIKESDTK